MQQRGMDRPPDAARTQALRLLSDLVGGGLEERMRVEAAARILVAVRRVDAAVAAAGRTAASAATPTEAKVAALARSWDPTVLTAQEFAESLSVVEIDCLLRDAPRWASRMWDRLTPLSEAERRRFSRAA